MATDPFVATGASLAALQQPVVLVLPPGTSGAPAPAPTAPASPAPAAPAPLATTTGTYPTTTAAIIAASPWNPTRLSYTQWVLATMDSELSQSPAYYISETSPSAYKDYCNIWAICQAERAQPGPNGLTVGQFMDQLLGT